MKENKVSKRYFIASWVVMGAGFLCLAYGMLCIPFNICPEKLESVRIALLVIGAGLVLLNLHFVTKRIQKTEEQIQKTNTQIKEQQRGNFLNSLHHGMDMLYEDISTKKPFAGVHQLYGLAIENKKNNPERVARIKDVFDIFHRKSESHYGEEGKVVNKDLFDLKQEVFNKKNQL